MAYTLQAGGGASLIGGPWSAATLADAAGRAGRPPTGAWLSAWTRSRARPVAFLFPGQGAQYVGHGRGSCTSSEPVFREALDRCAAILSRTLGRRPARGPVPGEPERRRRRTPLRQTALTQPALFAIEYALARLWMAWGIEPEAMIGHSVGEYVAACLAGVFSLEDALALVAARGRLMQELPGGSMLAVRLAASELAAAAGRRRGRLAAVNGPPRRVVSGPTEAVDAPGEPADGAGSRVPAAADLARVPLGDDGSDPGRRSGSGCRG